MEKVIKLDLSIVVLSYNRYEEIIRQIAFFEDLLKKYDIQVIIVDNNSNDGTINVLKKLHNKIEVIFNSVNKGVAGGRNSAIKSIEREYILRIDDDTMLTADDIIIMYEYMAMNHRVGAMSPRILQYNTNRSQLNLGDKEIDISNYHGACHLLRKGLVDIIGPIDKECDFGSEEIDYSIKIKNLGFDIKYFPSATVYHNNHIRNGGLGVWRKRRRLYNSVRTCFKYWPTLMAFRYSFRFYISHIISGVDQFGIKMILLHTFDCYQGIQKGSLQRFKLNKKTVEYYSQKKLKPDFGNVSVRDKIRKKFLD
jgi:GT2 family glycosyltransferase